MTVKTLRRQLAAAIAMTLVATVALGSSTYAWFTMNTKVTATGMEMRTKVSENLLIAPDTFASTSIAAETSFSNALVQLKDGLIEPVSTVDGKAFYYTAGTNVKGNGDALNDVYTLYSPAAYDGIDAAFEETYNATGDGAKGYIDYVYQLKAINGPTASEIRLTGLTLTYGGVSTDANGQKATRVAVFAENLGYKTGASNTTLVQPAGDISALSASAIFTPSGAVNFTDGQAVSSTTGLSTVTYENATHETFVLSVDTNRSQYYKIVVRVWLEGEDQTCNSSTFMDLTDKWSLDMQWDFVASTENDAAYDSVNYIDMHYTAAKTALLTTDAVDTTAANTVIISGVNYYPITGKTLGASGPDLYTTDTALTTNSKVFTIEGGLYPTNVTNQVSITTP